LIKQNNNLTSIILHILQRWLAYVELIEMK